MENYLDFNIMSKFKDTFAPDLRNSEMSHYYATIAESHR